MSPRREPVARRLADAAIEYAAAVEAEDPPDVRRAWDRLRHAATAYRDGPRPMGRPRNDTTQKGP